jgi:Zn-dependent peptidase ImmA (M78 family)
MQNSKIKNLVLDILGDSYTLPINVNKLAKDHGTKIVIDDLSSSHLSGFAFQKNNEKIIGVNESESEERKRFTIAHELGHLFLHKNAVNYDQGGIMLFRDGHSSEGTDLREVQANRFAAELLMPEPSIREDLAKEQSFDLMNDPDLLRPFVGKMAKKYKVSEQAMSIRLTTLYFG